MRVEWWRGYLWNASLADGWWRMLFNLDQTWCLHWLCSLKSFNIVDHQLLTSLLSLPIMDFLSSCCLQLWSNISQSSLLRSGKSQIISLIVRLIHQYYNHKFKALHLTGFLELPHQDHADRNSSHWWVDQLSYKTEIIVVNTSLVQGKVRPQSWGLWIQGKNINLCLRKPLRKGKIGPQQCMHL